MTQIPVGLQLHTVRQELMADMAGTLAKVAEMGYKGVELVPLKDGPPPAEIRSMIESKKLTLISSHVGFADLRDDFDNTIATHKELGHSDLVVGAVPADMRKSDDGWKEAVAQLDEMARKAKVAGFRVSMHNHAFELEKTVDGVEAHHYVFSQIPPDVLNAQLDTYFIQDVGKDPVEYIRKFAARVPLLHIKDKAKDSDPDDQTHIGNGVIDWDAVFAAAEESGVEWYIVEQKRESIPGIESARLSAEYMKSRGMV
ncbi:MAG: sugar phosphate isomerase/epimerase [Planctomycetes bacterium]|nr:sugar phosphate isomerase/epimerase [Planctomycetota bacterium]